MCVLGVFCDIKVVFLDIILCCKIWFTQLFEMKHIAKNTLFYLENRVPGPPQKPKRHFSRSRFRMRYQIWPRRNHDFLQKTHFGTSEKRRNRVFHDFVTFWCFGHISKWGSKSWNLGMEPKKPKSRFSGVLEKFDLPLAIENGQKPCFWHFSQNGVKHPHLR